MKKVKIFSVMTTAALIAALIGGCSGNKTEGGETVTWYVNGLISGDNKEEVMTKVNEILKEKYDMQLNMIGIDSGNFSSKLQVMNAGQEVYDLAFTSHWANNYLQNVNNGVFYELTEEELTKYAPKTYEFMSKDVWDAVKVDGKMYAVPNWQIQARSTGLYVPAEFLEKTGTKIEDINNLNDVTEYLRKITAINPKCNKTGKFWAQLMTYYGMTEVYEQDMPGAFRFMESGKPVIINQFETQEFEEYAALRRSWVAEGLSPAEYLPDSKSEKKEIMEAPISIHVWKPGGAEERTSNYGYEIQGKPFSGSLLTESGITAAMTGVSATSEHPTAALKMIEIINNDKEINNLLVFGIEGEDYEKVADNRIKVSENKNYTGPSNWGIGSIANSYLVGVQADTLVQDTKEFNDNAMPSPLLGFNANLDNISVQIANCKTVTSEYLELIDLGISSEEDYKTFLSKLKEAGVDEIIAELQAQVDEWWSNK